MSDFASIIEQLERQRESVEEALRALRSVSEEGTVAKRRGRPAKVSEPKRGLTDAGRKALAENMRRLWAAKRAAAGKSGGKKRSAKTAG